MEQNDRDRTNSRAGVSERGIGQGGADSPYPLPFATAWREPAVTGRGREEQRCGMYLRISKEDGDGQSESNSIANQRLMIQEFLRDRPQWRLIGEWVDDGFSGSRFDRPALQGLLQAAREGDIDCILVKDLSRFGREYIQTGQYLRSLFPQWGVRFIAIGDSYDSATSDFCEDTLLMPILTLMNDAYCRDISQKVRNGQNARRRRGDYVGAFAPYGYRKSRSDCHRLELDEGSAAVVKKIFSWRAGGHSAEKIAGYLNTLLIPSPYCYKKQSTQSYVSGFVDRNKIGLWSPVAVRRILKNQIYIGVLQQGKSRKVSYKLQKRQAVPERDWICVAGAVPQMIPEPLFEKCQGRLL